MAFTLVPTHLGRDWWDIYDHPSTMMAQLFGDTFLDTDLLQPRPYRGFVIHPRTQTNIEASGKSDVVNDCSEFKVALNVKQFKPEELEVKVVDNFVVVHGKHEERSDGHGYIAREFTRKYMLPAGCEEEKVASTLTSEGVLMIKVPKVVPQEKPKEERQIPIIREDPKAVKDNN